MTWSRLTGSRRSSPRAQALPDPALLQQAALALVTSAAPGWTRLTMIMFYEAPDVYGVRSWETGEDGGRTRTHAPTDAFLTLEEARAAQVAAGQDPWQRCDLEVVRSATDGAAQMSVDFAYEVGDVPE